LKNQIEQEKIQLENELQNERIERDQQMKKEEEKLEIFEKLLLDKESQIESELHNKK